MPARSGSDGPPLPTPTKTIATPATKTSTSPPPPQPGARPDPGIPAPTTLPVLAASSAPAPVPSPGPAPQAQPEPPPTPSATATGATTTTTPANPMPGYGYGYSPAAGKYSSEFTHPAQGQQFHPRAHPHAQPHPNSTSTPYASLYQPPDTSSQLPLYQTQGPGADEFDSAHGDGGFLASAKSWIASAGTKLAEVEAEVWKRINEAHDK